MKITICMLNSKFIHSSLAPWCLFAGVRAYCSEDFSAHVVEGTVNEKPQSVADRILSNNPDAIAFCCYIWNINRVYEICEIIRSRSDAKIILGGPEVTYNPEEVLENNKNVDFVLCGEGEESFAMLCRKMNGEDIVVNGLCSRENDEIVRMPSIRCMKEPVSPYTQEYFDALNGRIAYIETSRGCPFSCAFCLSGADKGVLFYNIDRVRREILALANSGTQTVKFVDRTFNANAARADEIITFIIDNYGTSIPRNVCFHFEIAVVRSRSPLFSCSAVLPQDCFSLKSGFRVSMPKR